MADAVLVDTAVYGRSVTRAQQLLQWPTVAREPNIPPPITLCCRTQEWQTHQLFYA